MSTPAPVREVSRHARYTDAERLGALERYREAGEALIEAREMLKRAEAVARRAASELGSDPLRLFDR